MTLKEKLAAARRRLELEQELEIYTDAIKKNSRYADFYKTKAAEIERKLER
jgi:hypothetical protein